MADRDIQIPFGPDKTGGLGYGVLSEEGLAEANEPARLSDATLPNPIMPEGASPYEASEPFGAAEAPVIEVPAVAQESAYDVAPAAQLADAAPYPQPLNAEPQPAADIDSASAAGPVPADQAVDDELRTGGMTDEEAAENGMDEMQMSILALKDSIGQGRELKAREKELDELREALEADYEELADRDNILANYETLVAEQDAIMAKANEQREAQKSELANATAAIDQTQLRLDQLREQYALQLQPLESELGRLRATADQAKNDERSRKSELSAAETEMRRSDEGESAMAAARHQQAESAYAEARKRSEYAKDQLSQAQKAYDDAKQQVEQATSPLERNIEDLTKQAESLKESISALGEEITVARKRRQYCDTVYQYPDETAKMHQEVEEAERAAAMMERENDQLRDQLADSKQKAKKAKIAIAAVIVLIIVIVASFIILSGR